MPTRLLQTLGLAAYGALARSGVLSRPFARRGFLTAYGIYKRLIEAGPVHRLQDYVPSGSTVIDVGANVGFFTLKFADWVGPSGRVIAIEPDTENFAALGRALIKSGVEARVTTRLAVAAAAPGSMRLQRNELHPGDHKIAVGGEAGLDVEAVAVDDLLAAWSKKTVSLMKIDVQGAEMMVLGGAGRTLSTPGLALFIEVDESALRRFGSSSDELCGFLLAQGFRMYRLVKRGPALALDMSTLRDELSRRSYVDVLFLRDADPLGQAA